RREERRQQRRGHHAGGRDGAHRGNATVAERQDTERDHERGLARPHRSERDLGAAERPTRRPLASRPRPIAEPQRETTRHDATIASRPLPRTKRPRRAIARPDWNRVHREQEPPGGGSLPLLLYRSEGHSGGGIRTRDLRVMRPLG